MRQVLDYFFVNVYAHHVVCARACLNEFVSNSQMIIVVIVSGVFIVWSVYSGSRILVGAIAEYLHIFL